MGVCRQWVVVIFVVFVFIVPWVALPGKATAAARAAYPLHYTGAVRKRAQEFALKTDWIKSLKAKSGQCSHASVSLAL